MGRQIQIVFALLLLMLAGCGGSKEVIQTPVVDERPSWVRQRPIRSGDYVGIGIAPKAAGADYRESAKKNALADLASEIEVTINSNSFLVQFERETGFREEFNQVIRASADQQLEGYEQVDNYEDDEYYYTYYRLNKLDFKEMQQQKREAAIRRSLDWYAKGNDTRAAGSIRQAMQFYFKALLAMQDHWNEGNEVELDGSSIFLDNEIYSALKATVHELRFERNDGNIGLDTRNDYRSTYEFRVSHDPTEQLQAGIPIWYSYPHARDRRYEMKAKSDESGRVSIVMDQVDIRADIPRLRFGLDLEQLTDGGEAAKLLLKGIGRNLEKNVEVGLDIRLPLIRVEGESGQSRNQSRQEQLQIALKSALAKEGYQLTDSRYKADLLMQIKSDSRNGNVSGKFHIAYVDLDIRVVKGQNSIQLYHGTEPSIKGVGLDFNQATDKAYDAASKHIEQKMIKEITRILP